MLRQAYVLVGHTTVLSGLETQTVCTGLKMDTVRRRPKTTVLQDFQKETHWNLKESRNIAGQGQRGQWSPSKIASYMT
jgi:hypothetical protein